MDHAEEEANRVSPRPEAGLPRHLRIADKEVFEVSEALQGAGGPLREPCNRQE